MAPDLLDRVLANPPAAFALLHRPGRVFAPTQPVVSATGSGTIEVLIGDVTVAETLATVPLPDAAPPAGGARHDVLAIMPYRQIAERGFACVDDGAPLLAMTVTEQAALPAAAAADRLPSIATPLSGGHFDIDDDGYAETVRRIVADEIGTGEGANFVIKRSYLADIGGYRIESALSLFRRLLQQESGAYWTFLVHTPDRTLVGASPERHVSLSEGIAVMNPISGTFRYPASGPTLPALMEFLADRKETDELYMVVDEELKMMARLCETGGRVVGPYLKEMTRLAHTEYFIEGRTRRDPREILAETMYAPTVTGSPLESACRVIRKYEPRGRGYYSGVLALIGRDAAGDRTLDSAIAIRTADIDPRGRVSIGVGGTLVRHSDPASEVAETRAKTAALLAALDSAGGQRLGGHPSVRAALNRRNEAISGFWLAADQARIRPEPSLAGRRVLVIDAEDTFTSMIDHQLRSLGVTVQVRRYDETYRFDRHDLVIMGPGPGDPREYGQHKIARLRCAVRLLLAEHRPFLAVCLSHQVLGTLLNLPLVRRDRPNQGVQREIDLFGATERVGFYNTFAVRSPLDEVDIEGIGAVQVSRDRTTGEVHALRGPGFASIQFHAESVLTLDGVRILGALMAGALHQPAPSAVA